MEETNAQEILRSYLQLQEQVQETRLAIERSRKDTTQAALENAQALATRLQAIEQSLAAQRARDLDSMQSSNRFMLTVAGVFATVGFLVLLLMVYFQWRTVNRLAEISAGFPLLHGLGPSPSLAALGAGEPRLVGMGSAESSSVRLLGAIDRLEKRIFELEHTAHPPPKETPAPAPEPASAATPSNGEAASPTPPESAEPEDGRINLLLGKGQSLLHLEKAEEALACFNQVLAQAPHHTEALLKKGAALERLRKTDEAIQCYDQAIAADGSLTLAYLYKAGLYNRLERFGEALACYEQALRTQEKRAQT